MSFQFLDYCPLIDGELELVQPQSKYVEDYLFACRHPTTVTHAPLLAKETRRRLQDLLDIAPLGHLQADERAGRVPGYHFWMRLTDRELCMAGGISLRIGKSFDLEQYVGHIGYHVFPSARGNHYAERSTRLLVPLARAHGLTVLWITCNPDNFASRRTCERLGAELVETVPVPKHHDLYKRGDREKCRYRLMI